MRSPSGGGSSIVPWSARQPARPETASSSTAASTTARTHAFCTWGCPMPSKGGRRQQAGTEAGVAGLAEALSAAAAQAQAPPDWNALGFAAVDLARPLQRGAETERFSDLA